jgi:hypothetical protein
LETPPLLLLGIDEMVPVSVPVPHPRNPRRGDTDAIRQSLRKNGFFGRVLLQRKSSDGTEGYIIVGQHRWQAWTAEGGTEIPVTWLDVDDEAAQRIRIADNATNDLSTYDKEMLAAVLHELDLTEGGLAGTTFDKNDFAAILLDLDGNARARVLGETKPETILENASGGGSGPLSGPASIPPSDSLGGGSGSGGGSGFSNVPTSEESGGGSGSGSENKPNGPSESTTRMVQLYLTTGNIGDFQSMIDALSKKLETDNITDTVLRAIEYAYRQHYPSP